MDSEGVEGLVAGIRGGERRALAKAITLIESLRVEDDHPAAALLEALASGSGTALRVAISGPPGAGKSTLIEALGLRAVAHGIRTAVLTIDPSSRRSGGSILGDKTRMPRLSVHPLAFIRPSAAGMTLGGVARRTRETMTLLEAAGFGLILVETVGVGQSETEVDGMVDLFALVLLPNAGDELQGIKRGIMELAGLVLINKADGLFTAAAELTQAQVRAALPLLHRDEAEGGWQPRVLLVSALEERGIEEVLESMLEYRRVMTASGALTERRLSQAGVWMWDRVHDGLRRQFLKDPEVRRLVGELEPSVRRGEVGAVAAAERLLQVFCGGGNGNHVGNH
ncbi:MAG: methylmalonyl Co-A mutase-associated GTPase MeaB [Magnetococcales bacterium]|nr:methylmalonyl Co-A mutase-associated GTPase MeaB [Magnetococcales bacterium]